MEGTHSETDCIKQNVLKIHQQETQLGVCWCSAGDMYEVGAESGRYYCLNVPLRDGIDDQSELTSCTTL